MHYKLGFKGQYVSAVELTNKSPTLTITSVVIEKVESMQKDDDGAGKMKDKIIVYFAEADRGMVLNRTNAECIVALWGAETNGWVGHKLTIFATQVRVGPKMEAGIRIKGSPELTAPKQVEVKLPRKKATTMTLIPTGKEPPKAEDEGPPPADDDAGGMVLP